MKKIIKFIVTSFFLISLFIAPIIASAQSATSSNKLLDRLTRVAGSGGYQTDPSKASTPIIIGTVIGAFLGFLGITFIVIMLIAGNKWMTAKGNDEQITKAKDSIREAVIGLVVSLAAYSIWNFVFNNIIVQ